MLTISTYFYRVSKTQNRNIKNFLIKSKLRNMKVFESEHMRNIEIRNINIETF